MKPELFNSLKNYKKKYILNDLLAGLMVAIIALPLSIALGIQSMPEGVGNGIQAGIITAIVAGFFISFLGGSRFQIGGPTAAFVVILFGYLSDPDIGLLGLALAGIMAGVLLILMGLLRVGNVMKFFPYPITIGFTTGIGITLLIGQVKDLCGFEASGTEAIEKIVSYVQNIHTFDLATFLVGALGLLCVIIIPKINKKIPSAFVALILCTIVTQLLNNFAGTSIATISESFGTITAGFNLIDFSGIGSVKFPSLIVPAIVIAFLCAIESLLSATVASGMTGTSFSANQELIGQGVANICSSLVGGLPATGAIARTAAGIENGARSPLTGVFHAIFLLIMYFALMSVVGLIPLTVFSAILISVAINMSRFKLFAKLTAFGIRDSIILIVTCALTIIFDLTYGVIGGVAITLIANIGSFKRGLSIDRRGSLIKAKGSVNFVSVNKIINACGALAKEQKITIDLSSVDRIDETALEKLASLSRLMKKEERELNIIKLKPRVQKRFDKFFSVV
ncbi:MAG: STAS domain-containing protein [Clostridia bacterium]|nr:STAS domain-containing protein [Clostridia bacterium]